MPRSTSYVNPLNIRQRDTQRKKVYRAEWLAFNKIIAAFGSHSFNSTYEMQNFANAVCADKKVQERYPRARGLVIRCEMIPNEKSFAGRTLTTAYSTRIILAGNSGNNRMVMLHELAHAIVGSFHRHGPAFVECYMFLIKRYYNQQAVDIITEFLALNRVRIMNSAGKPVRVRVSKIKKERKAKRVPSNPVGTDVKKTSKVAKIRKRTDERYCPASGSSTKSEIGVRVPCPTCGHGVTTQPDGTVRWHFKRVNGSVIDKPKKVKRGV